MDIELRAEQQHALHVVVVMAIGQVHTQPLTILHLIPRREAAVAALAAVSQNLVGRAQAHL